MGKVIEVGADFYFVPVVLRDTTMGAHGFMWKHHDMLIDNAKAMARAAAHAPDIIVRRSALRMEREYVELAKLIAVHLPPRLITP